MSNLKRWVQVGQGEFTKWVTIGQTIEGIWRGTKDGQYGPLGLVDTEEGRVSFPLPTALLQRTEALRVGAEVRIAYQGKRTGKTGREYHDFHVFVADPDKDILDPAAKPDEDMPF